MSRTHHHDAASYDISIASARVHERTFLISAAVMWSPHFFDMVMEDPQNRSDGDRGRNNSRVVLEGSNIRLSAEDNNFLEMSFIFCQVASQLY